MRAPPSPGATAGRRHQPLRPDGRPCRPHRLREVYERDSRDQSRGRLGSCPARRRAGPAGTSPPAARLPVRPEHVVREQGNGRGHDRQQFRRLAFDHLRQDHRPRTRAPLRLRGRFGCLAAARWQRRPRDSGQGRWFRAVDVQETPADRHRIPRRDPSPIPENPAAGQRIQSRRVGAGRRPLRRGLLQRPGPAEPEPGHRRLRGNAGRRHRSQAAGRPLALYEGNPSRPFSVGISGRRLHGDHRVDGTVGGGTDRRVHSQQRSGQSVLRRQAGLGRGRRPSGDGGGVLRGDPSGGRFKAGPAQAAAGVQENRLRLSSGHGPIQASGDLGRPQGSPGNPDVCQGRPQADCFRRGPGSSHRQDGALPEGVPGHSRKVRRARRLLRPRLCRLPARAADGQSEGSCRSSQDGVHRGRSFRNRDEPRRLDVRRARRWNRAQPLQPVALRQQDLQGIP